MRNYLLLFVGLTICAVPGAHGMDWEGRRMSSNIEDRREGEGLTTRMLKDRGRVLASCDQTIIVERPDLQKTFVVKVQGVCEEDAWALRQAIADGVVDPDASPDH